MASLRCRCTSHGQLEINLTHTLRTMDLSQLTPFCLGQPEKFANFMDQALGLH
uniref:Uncharacterized protein n=1 Tax=Paramormyrops kingsleyae TaxID=1676925 RepID=A0A3B3QRB7_9TELE